jgi:peptidyl-prolyl cis-trans isomerase C
MIVLRDATIDHLMDREEVTEEEVKEAYETAFPTEPSIEYKVRHILVAEEEKAKELINQLDAGRDFAELAKAHSTGPSAPSGGKLGEWISLDTVAPPFAEGVKTLEKGKYTAAPVKTRFGWHVILLEDTKEIPPAERPEFDSVKMALTEQIKAERVQQQMQKLRDGLDIQTPDDSLIRINQPEAPPAETTE